ncbi:hypothetical protein [Dictyobacter arantiisoli]|uniref:DUF4878 domain-containing protein n=1 Tax=Dictyobacter arantiisoli TaxID=2014874 RepID=A0A5A5T580_9CHLR|nr:hypothetical protein [Dictyobacter arantiisoli]GCF06452.1 hypothetical protein KDI_00160 [Dictyobacter arantiisoli]
MQTSDESPEEKQPASDQQTPLNGISPTPATQPISVEPALPADLKQSEQSRDTSLRTDSNAVHQEGLVYPPLPSFYEEMPSPPQQSIPEVPRVPQAEQIPTPPVTRQEELNSPPAFWQGPVGQPLPPGYPPYPQGQSYLGNQPPPFVVGPPRPKKTNKWTVIAISILVGLLLLSCGICFWAGTSMFGGMFNQVYNGLSNGTQVVNNFYDALQNKQYAQAYHALKPQGSLKNISEQDFITRAEKQDTLYGPVLRYSVGQPDLSKYDGQVLDTISLPVDVARTKKSYTAHIQLKLINNQWKITAIDNL